MNPVTFLNKSPVKASLKSLRPSLWPCYNRAMKKFIMLTGLAALTSALLLASPTIAQEEGYEGGGGGGGPRFLIGPSAELIHIHGPKYMANHEDKSDTSPGMLLGLYAGSSGLEIRPQALIGFDGQYRGFLVDAGLRITPKWFGFDEYIFNLVSPYAVLGGSVGYPWSLGWHAKAGLGVALLQYGSINAEIGYRSHRFDDSIQLDGVTVGLRATYPL